MSFEFDLIDEINSLRTNPKGYADKIRRYKGYFEGNVLRLPDSKAGITTIEGPSAYEEAAHFLDRAEDLKALIPSKGLMDAAKTYYEKTKNEDPSNIDNIEIDNIIEQYGEFNGNFSRAMEFGGETPEQIVINLVVNDGDPNRGQRELLFSKRVKKVGVTSGSHDVYRKFTVILSATYFTNKDGDDTVKRLILSPTEINNKDGEATANILHEALSGKNRDETILDVIKNNNLERRIIIAKKYEEAFGSPLYEDVKYKLSGDSKELAGYLFLAPMEFTAKKLKRGFKGLSVDESAIFEVLVSHKPEEYEKIKEAYKIETKKDLTKDIEKNFSGEIKKALLTIISTPRRNNLNPDKCQCERLADMLIKVGESNWVKNEDVFKSVFIECSPEEIVLTSRYYYKKTKNIIIDVIEKKCSGKSKTLLREILFGNIIPHELFAEKIHLAIKGLGTNTALLNRVLAERYQVDFPEINEIYLWKYKVPLSEDIKGDTSGIYQKLCLNIIES